MKTKLRPPAAAQSAEPHPSQSLKQIPINEIRVDGGTQTRVGLNEEIVTDYASVMSEIGASAFPPVLVFRDDENRFWLADGFHRVAATRTTGCTEIAAEIREGSRFDAFKFSLGANSAHGLRRTNADKRHSVMLAFNEETLRGSSDHVIAELCGVSNHLVGAVRAEREQNQSEQLGISPSSMAPAKRKGRDGKLRPSRPKAKKVPARNIAVPAPDAREKSGHMVTPATPQSTEDLPGDQNVNTGTEPTTRAAEIASEDRADASNNSMEIPGSMAQLPEDAAHAASQAPAVSHPVEYPRESVAPRGTLVTEEQLQERLGRVRETHPSDRYDEQQAEVFKQHIISFVHTANRFTYESTLPRSVHKRVATDAATALGKFFASLPSLPD